MSQNREKEIFSDPSNIIVSLNGVQVFLDNKFEDEILNEGRSDISSEKNKTDDTDEIKKG